MYLKCGLCTKGKGDSRTYLNNLSKFLSFNDEMIYEMDHIGTADMKSSEAMILAAMIRSSYMIHFIYHFIIDSFLTETLEPTNDQLPTSVAS